jgi:hypothetical protein
MNRTPGLSLTARRTPKAKSATRARCTCRFLERTAAEPNEPIVFDADLNEYHPPRPQGG